MKTVGWMVYGLGLVAASAFAGVRFQEASPLGAERGPVMVTLGAKGSSATALPPAVAVSAVIPTFDEPVAAAVPTGVSASGALAAPAVAPAPAVGVSASAPAPQPAPPNTLPICADALALVRGIGLTMYAQRTEEDVMKVVLAAALAERSARAGVPPVLLSLQEAVGDVPSRAVGMGQLDQAMSAVTMACPAVKVKIEVERPI